MATLESSTSKPHQSGTWNVVRSRSVPSGVSGTYPILRPLTQVTTDESILLKAEKDEVEQTQRQLKSFQFSRPSLLRY